MYSDTQDTNENIPSLVKAARILVIVQLIIIGLAIVIGGIIDNMPHDPMTSVGTMHKIIIGIWAKGYRGEGMLPAYMLGSNLFPIVFNFLALRWIRRKRFYPLLVISVLNLLMGFVYLLPFLQLLVLIFILINPARSFLLRKVEPRLNIDDFGLPTEDETYR